MEFTNIDFEEEQIYKTFGTTGKMKFDCRGRTIEYNERTPKKWKCGCGGHSLGCYEKFNRGFQAIMKSGCEWSADWFFETIKRRKKNAVLLQRRAAMRQGRSAVL